MATKAKSKIATKRTTTKAKKKAVRPALKRATAHKAAVRKAVRGFAPTRLKLRQPVPSDIEIAQEAKLKPIQQVAEEMGIRPDELELYGPYKAKVKLEILERLKNRPNGRCCLQQAKYQYRTMPRYR